MYSVVWYVLYTTIFRIKFRYKIVSLFLPFVSGKLLRYWVQLHGQPEIEEKFVDVGRTCDPAMDLAWYPVKGDFTKFVFCSPTKKVYIENSCPQLMGMPQFFDDETRLCFTPRNRHKRTPGIPKSSGVGEPCIFNTDCMDNMYCPSGRCLCNPGYVGAPNSIQSCIRALNPGQTGCQFDVQCDGGWPGATCSGNVCVCPASGGVALGVAQTFDGAVCVVQSGALATALCPLPDGLAAGSLDSGDILRQLPNVAARRECTVGSITVTLAADGTGSCAIATEPDIGTDIYDCIPHTAGGQLGVCCPSRAMVCILPKRPGTGNNAAGTRYWYNSVTNLCEPFAWALDGTTAPTDTNSNNFRTIEQCYAYCRGTCQRGNPKLTGPAAAAAGNPVSRTTTCSSDSQCAADTGAGATAYQCKTTVTPSICCPIRTATCSLQGGRGNAHYTGTPTAGDPGNAYQPAGLPTNIQRWYWSSTQATCIMFTYNGHGGNFNNFLSQQDCLTYCGTSICTQGSPLKDQNGNNQPCSSTSGCPSTYECRTSTCCPRPQTVCIQPKQPGTCANIAQRYWYNVNTRDCEVFDFSGCGGNDNNFADYSTCVSYCRDIKPQPRCIQGEAQKDGNGVYRTCSTSSTGVCIVNYECYFDGSQFGCCPTKAATCNSAKVEGNLCVTAGGSRWYYNPTTRLCDSFTYRGCDGNSNNFINRDDCERYCGASGCPYGGQPFSEPSTGSRRICSTGIPCPSGFECLNVLISNSPLNVCCLSRMTICSQNPIQGSQLGSQTSRYYFNPSTRLCSTFTFFGTGGNENNFVTASQCTNFCNSAACALGESVLLDPNNQLPVTCNSQLQNSCQTGYTCRQDTLFNRFVCCGSTDMGVCPAGEKAFVEPLTLQPRECTISLTTNQCGNNFLCRINLQRNRNYCCGSTTGVFCPPGKAVLRDTFTMQPRSCFPSSIDQCQNSQYTCQPLTSGQSGYCCSTAAICPNNANFLVDANQNPRACTIQVGVNPCGTGATCQNTNPGSTQGFCCQTTGGGDGCPIGQPVLIVNGQVQTCGGFNVAPFCPTSPFVYTCVMNSLVSPARFQCCSTGSIVVTTFFPPTVAPTSRCPFSNMSPYLTPGTSSPVSCNPRANNCPNSYPCLNNGQGFICCQPLGGGSQCPAGSTVQIGANGQPQSCVGTTCSGNFRCQYSTTFRNYYCCSSSTVVGSTACPTGTPYFTPGSPTPARCTVGAQAGTIGACPTSYNCVNSPQYSTTICCSGSFAANALPTDTANCTPIIFPNTNKALSCEGKENGCPPPATCKKIATYSHKVCC